MSKIIDFHSHVLPGIDDGSASIEESLEMLRCEAQQGVEVVIATPHFYAQHDRPEVFLRRREAAVQKLRAAMAEDADLPEMLVGAEVYYYPGVSQSDLLEELVIEGSRCVLMEMPIGPWSEAMYRELEQIRQRRDLIPVMAHIDRYVTPFRVRGILKRLEEIGVVVQANASFFLNNSTRRMALRMLKKEQIQVLGSDCHNMQERSPKLGKALEVIEQRLGHAVIEKILDHGKVLHI